MQRLKQNNNDQKQKLVYLQGLKTKKTKKIQESKAKIDIFAETKNIVKAIEIQK